jgi:hypothetical protein
MKRKHYFAQRSSELFTEGEDRAKTAEKNVKKTAQVTSEFRTVGGDRISET